MASFYHLPKCPVNSRPVTGDFLARNQRDRGERVLLALDLYFRRVTGVCSLR
jgi:hypothetical protein